MPNNYIGIGPKPLNIQGNLGKMLPVQVLSMNQMLSPPSNSSLQR